LLLDEIQSGLMDPRDRWCPLRPTGRSVPKRFVEAVLSPWPFRFRLVVTVQRFSEAAVAFCTERSQRTARWQYSFAFRETVSRARSTTPLVPYT